MPSKQHDIAEKIKEHARLTDELHKSWALQAVIPSVYDGECVRAYVGFKFSMDGEYFSLNSFNPLSMRESPMAFYNHSIAVVSRKDSDGNVIEEIELPPSALPPSLLPIQWRRFTE